MSSFTQTRKLLTHGSRIPSDRQVVWSMGGGRCFWCDCVMLMNGSPHSPRALTVEHIHERASGLPRDAVKVAACKRCNSDRGNIPAEAYWALWGLRIAADQFMRALV